MLWGGSCGALEVRNLAGGETRLSGRFPYGVPAVLARRGGDVRREVFEPRAFAPALEAGADVHLLIGHDFDRPIASRAAGSLTLEDGDDALIFEAALAPEMRGVGFVADFLGTLAAGLVRGLSPGFQVAEGGEMVKRDGEGLIRVVSRANLIELSAVTRPVYEDAAIEARSWALPKARPEGLARTLQRWRR